MSYGEQMRGADRWGDLDALVREEMDALGGRRVRHGPLQPPPAEAFREPPGPPEAEDADEDSFIERTVDYLRGRPDAEALIEAVRASLYDEDPGQAEPPEPAEDEVAAAVEPAAPTELGAGP